MTNQFVFISAKKQQLYCYDNDTLCKTYPVSTAKNGLGELEGSQCTPRGWHRIHSHIGMEAQLNSVFVGRRWTGEVYSPQLAVLYPNRDWILTRIIQLDGLEKGRNKEGRVDSLQRYIYIHGTPDSTKMNNPKSHGCIRMYNADIVEFAEWVKLGTYVCIE
ncbi:putative ErfK/YbiS/YcfS/YnhG protein [Legionella beliardensis]|uniref:Putative ErfK/YbiS/YcfS/YnhG protein n=1 Tax=Legionella beliardensis TaxID=91822 RepID=A0A378I1V6_9GAMM|nr:L,D-transpeptidase [Legionella beliardensis]STX29158.1 putative ErfK/YbiS/YcfS/YnhG protein [Legionella beliardensis]